MGKKEKLIILLITLTLIGCQDKKDDIINQSWLEKDLMFLADVRDQLKSSPDSIDKIIPRVNDADSYSLGNGYSMEKGSRGYGYVSIFYEYIVKENSIYSYKILLTNDDYSFLKKNTEFDVDMIFPTRDRKEFAYFHNLEMFLGNSSEIFHEMRHEFEYYITPYSGIFYGCTFHYGGELLLNRALFNLLNNSHNDISSNDLRLMLLSINPATRLTGVEYYMKNIEKFKSDEIELIIENIFIQFPKAPLIESDEITYVDSKKLVEYSLKNCD